jgi:putative ABC transport system ATP-binding protein
MPAPVIELRNVRKSFAMPGGETVDVLDIDEFVLGEGEQCALEGQSGSGKSTLLNVISGIMRPDAGSVLIDSLDIARLDEARRDRVRAKPDRRRAADLLSAVGLSHRLDHKPAALSIGQQQRVAVARALANRPRVVLADEPTASIDSAHQQQVIDLLRDSCRAQGAALLVVTHAPEVAGQFPRRVRLESFNRAARHAEPGMAAAPRDGGRA